jgi:CheY-like chemotaxis protein
MTPAASKSRPVVLLVEDEPLQRLMLFDLIEGAGCEVVEATSGMEAVAILEGRADIRVVVADLDVRGTMAGMKLAAMIRDRWPPIELILTGSVRPRMEAIPARGVFHDKPVDQNRLAASIQQFVAET